MTSDRELKRRGRRELDASRMDGLTISTTLKADHGTAPSTHCKDEDETRVLFRSCNTLTIPRTFYIYKIKKQQLAVRSSISSIVICASYV